MIGAKVFAPIIQGTLHFPYAGLRQLPFCGLAVRQHPVIRVLPDSKFYRNLPGIPDYFNKPNHTAHEYLFSQFYSPITKHRKDNYTGDRLNGKIHFHLEMLRAIRKTVGKEFPVSIRFGAYDYREGGSSMAEMLKSLPHPKDLCRRWADILNISCSLGGGNLIFQTQEGTFSELSEIAKTVIAVGNIHAHCSAEALFQAEKADIIAIGRPIFKDADFAKKK